MIDYARNGRIMAVRELKKSKAGYAFWAEWVKEYGVPLNPENPTGSKAQDPNLYTSAQLHCFPGDAVRS